LCAPGGVGERTGDGEACKPAGCVSEMPPNSEYTIFRVTRRVSGEIHNPKVMGSTPRARLPHSPIRAEGGGGTGERENGGTGERENGERENGRTGWRHSGGMAGEGWYILSHVRPMAF
jgi:hypothetical protein